MATVVQNLPSPTMMQQRPNSAGRYNSGSSQYLHNSRPSQGYVTMPTTGYRGVPSAGPVAPYAFTSTPQLGQINAFRSQTSSAGPVQAPQLSTPNIGGMHLSPSVQSKQMPPSPIMAAVSRPVENMSRSSSSQSLNTVGQSKNTPDRYRRNTKRTDTAESTTAKPHVSALPSGSGMAAVGTLYSNLASASSTPSLTSNTSYRGTTYTQPQLARKSNDDLQTSRQPSPDLAARYRRRSLGNIDTPGLIHAQGDTDQDSPHPNTVIQPPGGDYMSLTTTSRPSSAHKYTTSAESANSSSQSNQSSRPDSASRDSVNSQAPQPAPVQFGHIARQDVRNGSVTMPARTHDTSRRTSASVTAPSPLSRPMALNEEPKPQTARSAIQPSQSPAVEHLAAINQKEEPKKKSKLRRAFSFGSSAELRRATTQANMEKSNAPPSHIPATKRLSRQQDELDPESARIAAKQEAAGLGESIYSGQGNFFTGSTDNLSISSTASSASIMLRKMGKGLKKGGRSMVGLFRPKSVVGVPAADAPINVSAAQVSMVTVEAEREKVNVNVDPHAHAGGGTGFPKLERNSMDNKMSIDSSSMSNAGSRQSIVGGERERAEVLATIKKGILKRADSNQSSPSLRPIDLRSPGLILPNIPHVTDSPHSSAPTTPKDEVSGQRGDNVTITGQDQYFTGTGSDRYESLDSQTGQPRTPARKISFSPRLTMHDTWTGNEYDRRGEIATCNRLTPMLAQQIKEELNSFKMEMEVHESSKVYTHFF